MNKYLPLQQYLEKCEGLTVTVTYEQIERIIEDNLPMSAHKYPAWWSNGSHKHADSWLGAGWRVYEVRFSESVTFEKQ